MDFTPQDFHLNGRYLGAGYGVVGDLEREAIALMAQMEGVLLDPVYAGRAMGGLLDLIRNRVFQSGKRFCFGTPVVVQPYLPMQKYSSVRRMRENSRLLMERPTLLTGLGCSLLF